MSALETTRTHVGRRGLVRPRRGRLLAGVAAGVARRFHTSPALVRILLLVSLLLPGPQVLGYLALWVLMPKER
ncbi:MAG TPA: PspC domain-containing protein [Solirubrobacteraceae bacterium]|nr:PspC domain-containing protein [Solirubrobacteraceae bacterium]